METKIIKENDHNKEYKGNPSKICSAKLFFVLLYHFLYMTTL